MTSVAAPAGLRLGIDEYLAWEAEATLRHEYVDGIVYAMVGATARHNLIVGNLFAHLHGRLPDPCQVFQTDMKLKVEAARGFDFFYPDLMVSCDPTDREDLFRAKPTLVVEVLSETTKRIDRNEKLASYTTIPSLEEYVVVAQDVPQAEMFRRRSAWRSDLVYLDQNLVLESVGLTLPLATLYRRTGLTAPEQNSER